MNQVLGKGLREQDGGALFTQFSHWHDGVW